MTGPIYRFAPSPNGYLHLGHAFSAALNFTMARRDDGRLLLRIEDIDRTRCRVEYELAIYQDLGWLGISWEEPVWRESAHLDTYRSVLSRLDAMGVLYASFESRTEISRLVAAREQLGPWPRDPDGVPLYPGNGKHMSLAERKRRIAAGEPYALRLDVALATELAAEQAGGAALTWIETGAGPKGQTGTIPANPAVWGDVVLARKDVPGSYHLCVVVDDALQDVTHVVRGEDLFESTSLHRLLQVLLDFPPPVYHHHRLIRDSAGRKLSKSTAATGLRELRAAGATPREIWRLIGIDAARALSDG